MRQVFRLALLLLLGFWLNAAHAQSSDITRPELRAFWVDSFNDGFKTPEQCDLLMTRLRQTHCNAVFIQVRKRADAYYRSHYEPWAADDTDAFDALAYVCKLAHAPGQPRIQVHAWVNACAVGGNKNPNSITKLHPDWFSVSDSAADFDGEATKIDPGNPEAADWTYRVYLDIARHYDIDGLHFDFIRYGGTDKTVGHWGYNPVSVARFNQRYGTTGAPLWNDPKWQAWRREQVTNLVRRVYVNATAIKPHLILSAATICWGAAPADDTEYETKSSSYVGVFAPWRDWLRDGILDLNCPMAYFTQRTSKAKWEGWSVFIKDHQYDRRAAMGVGIWLNPIADSQEQMLSTRVPTALGNTAAGIVFYSYASTEYVKGDPETRNNEPFYQNLTAPEIFPTDVPVPSMPWKDSPTNGQIMGCLFADTSLAPADGAVIELCGLDGREITTVHADGNGFFAFANVPPGSYQLLRTDFLPVSSGVTVLVLGKIQVKAGQTAIWRDQMSGKARSRVFGIGALPDGTSVTLSNALVTNGADRLGTVFYVADAFGKPTVCVTMPPAIPVTVAGDRVAVAGVISHDNGQLVLHATAVRHLGAELIK